MSIEDKANGEAVALMVNAWEKHKVRTGSNETLLHYIHSQMCDDCRSKYVKEHEQHLPRRTPYFLDMLRHRGKVYE